MAELDVQPKKSTPWWIWLLLLLIIALILYFLFGRHNSTETQTVVTDSTSTTKTVAATQPDWNSVDFNSPKSSYDEVTEKDVTVSGNNRYTIYTLGENILFATGNATVQTGAQSSLKQIAASLTKRFKGSSIGIYGNTDSTGTAETNKQLGAQRAMAVKTWLVQNGGFDSTKVSIHSLGESKPVASNATSAGRQQNRNVEIVAFIDSLSHK